MLGLQVCHLLMSLTFPELCDGAREGDPGDKRTLNAPDLGQVTTSPPCVSSVWAICLLCRHQPMRLSYFFKA